MNVLLVDDQEKILEATRKLVDWNRLGVKEVWTAGHAMDARAVLADKQIDIVLVDIEMPGENGVELQHWIYQTYPDIACIFLTSHADFSYAQEAIRNGAFDYILQPADFSEIERVVGKCIAYLKERRQIMRKSTQFEKSQGDILKNHVLTMFHQGEQFVGMSDWKQDTQTDMTTCWYLPCLIKVFQSEKKADAEDFIRYLRKAGIGHEGIAEVACRLDDSEIGCVFYGKDKLPDIQWLKDRLWFGCQENADRTGCKVNLYLGQYVKEDLPKQIGKIVEFKSKHIVRKNEAYIIKEKIPKEIKKPDSSVWSRWLIRQDTILLRNQIMNLLRFAEQEQYLTIGYMQMLIHSFLEACSIACYEQKKNLSDLFHADFTYEQMLNAWTSVEDLGNGVSAVLYRYSQMFNNSGEDAAWSAQERIQEVLRYLEENMDRMISRREAAKYVFLNEDYFSRIFRRETGIGYKEYVLKQKVDYAEKLLKNTDMPVVMVSSRVGYENYTNFTQMFRKVTGITPTEYRKRNQNTDKS